MLYLQYVQKIHFRTKAKKVLKHTQMILKSILQIKIHNCTYNTKRKDQQIHIFVRIMQLSHISHLFMFCSCFEGEWLKEKGH